MKTEITQIQCIYGVDKKIKAQKKEHLQAIAYCHTYTQAQTYTYKASYFHSKQREVLMERSW